MIKESTLGYQKGRKNNGESEKKRGGGSKCNTFSFSRLVSKLYLIVEGKITTLSSTLSYKVLSVYRENI